MRLTHKLTHTLPLVASLLLGAPALARTRAPQPGGSRPEQPQSTASQSKESQTKEPQSKEAQSKEARPKGQEPAWQGQQVFCDPARAIALVEAQLSEAKSFDSISCGEPIYFLTRAARAMASSAVARAASPSRPPARPAAL